MSPPMRVEEGSPSGAKRNPEIGYSAPFALAKFSRPHLQ